MRVPALVVALVGASAPRAAARQPAPRTYTDPGFPLECPLPGRYTGALRPQVHYSPPAGFMNDPNGLVFDSTANIWHLYYQYNPHGIVAGNQHWGHATSQDLFSWTNQKIARFPPEERVYVFSGSAVVDANNTSGLFPPGQTNGIVAIATLARYYADGSPGPQQQAVAYSLDGGYTFASYAGNPVIASNSTQFRDPKVVWYADAAAAAGGHWVMVVAYAQDFAIGIFTSPDLLHWTAASNVSTVGLLGTQYECPNLVQMPVRDAVGGAVVDTAWVLAISVQPGAPLGGSATQYFPGTFDGRRFTPHDRAARLAEFAKDNYAAQYFSGLPPGRNAVNLGWASNWQYAQAVPSGTREGWRSAMTLPREHYLVRRAPRIGYTLVNAPVDLAPVRDAPPLASVAAADAAAAAAMAPVDVDFAAVPSNAVEVEVAVGGLDASAMTAYSTLNVTIGTPDLSQALRMGFFFAGDSPFFLDRGGVAGAFGDNVFATDKFSVADVWDAAAGTWRLQAVVDRSVLEVFVDGGLHTATTVFYPDEGVRLTRLQVAVADLPPGARLNVTVWGLKSTWAAMADAEGVVQGNCSTDAAHSTVPASESTSVHDFGLSYWLWMSILCCWLSGVVGSWM